MFSNFALKIPLLQCIIYFPVPSHKKAGLKFIVLLIATSLPVIVAAVLTPIPTGDAGLLTKLGSKFSDAVAVPELFVYATGFLTPYLYLVFERFIALRRKLYGEATGRDKLDLFPGYFFVLSFAVVLIGATALAFGLLKSGSSTFQSSFLYHWLNGYAFWVYIFGLFCWYLTLLDESHDPGVYGRELGDSGADLSDALEQRLKERG